MGKCYVTGKCQLSGNNRSHSLRATRRVWKLNLQKVKIKQEDGTIKTVKVSARALRKNNLQRV